MTGAGEEIRIRVASWPGVEALPHRFGGVEYRYGRKEMGHVHGDRLADLRPPRKLHDQVIAAGRAPPHHVLPETGWVSCWLKDAADVENAIALLRIQYECCVRAPARAEGQVLPGPNQETSTPRQLALVLAAAGLWPAVGSAELT